MANACTLQQIYKPQFELLENSVLKLHKAQHGNQHYGNESLQDLHMHHWKPTTLHILDSNLSMSQHISNTCKAAYIQIRHISSIRHLLTTQATQTLVCSLVLSRLDYCNSLLSGCPQYLLDKLQKVQNAAARLVCKAKKSDHIHPILETLHWLPVTHHIQYKKFNYLLQLHLWNSPSVSVRSPSTLYSSKTITICIWQTNLCHPPCKHKNIWWKIFFFFLCWPICLEQFASNTPPLWFYLLF